VVSLPFFPPPLSLMASLSIHFLFRRLLLDCLLRLSPCAKNRIESGDSASPFSPPFSFLGVNDPACLLTGFSPFSPFSAKCRLHDCSLSWIRSCQWERINRYNERASHPPLLRCHPRMSTKLRTWNGERCNEPYSPFLFFLSLPFFQLLAFRARSKSGNDQLGRSGRTKPFFSPSFFSPLLSPIKETV